MFRLKYIKRDFLQQSRFWLCNREGFIVINLRAEVRILTITSIARFSVGLTGMYSAFLLLLASATPIVSAQSASWSAAYSKATAALSKLSQNDKIGMVTGVGWGKGPCVGNTAAPSGISFPSLCIQDSPLGVRYANPVTAFPAGTNAGMTWDRTLMNQRGAALGAESKGLGVHVQLGPVAGPLGKIAQGGRGWEGFGTDPYLSGVAMIETITGMQSSGTQACAKVCISPRSKSVNENDLTNLVSTILATSKSLTGRQ